MPTCWCVSDGRPGNENQATGLAEALGLIPVLKRVSLRQPWRILAPPLTILKRHAIRECAGLSPPWPDILIGAGRGAVLPSLFVKGSSDQQTYTVQLLDPVWHRRLFDRLVIPAHDAIEGSNVIQSIGSLHGVTQARLHSAAQIWTEQFAQLPRPMVAVLLGGSNRYYRFGVAEARDLAAQLVALSQKGFGLAVTSSRRTSPEVSHAIETALQDTSAFIWDSTGRNPYPGMLATACAFIVTADSVNMISEACSTGRPVYTVPLPEHSFKGSDKFRDFQASLLGSGRIRVFAGAVEPWSYTPLRESERIAPMIKADFLSRRTG